MVSIAHGTEVDLFGSFEVSLSKELFRYAVSPLPVELQRLRRVAKISAVEKTLKDLRKPSHNKLSSSGQ